MRGFASCFVALLIGLSACGKVPEAPPDGGDAIPDAPGGCTGTTAACGTDNALYQCDPVSGSLTKVQDCQYGCTVDHCNECQANTTFCSGDDLVMCDGNGTIVSPMTCTNGCQSNRCNTCKPGVAYCDSSGNAVTCGLDGLPGTTMACGAAGCINGVCNTCQPNTTTCQGDNLVVCNAGGTVQSATSCALGCGISPNPHCNVLMPLYGVSTPTGTLPDVLVDANATLNISNCSNTPASVSLTIGTTTTTISGSPQVANIVQNTGIPLCVVRFNKITIGSGFTLTVMNDATSGHVLSLQGKDDIQINGTITFLNSAVGPSAGVTADVVGSNVNGAEVAPGAGGGGGARAGGNGGACNGCGGTNVPGKPGGAAIDSTTAVTALTPGSKGGNVFSSALGGLFRGIGGAGGGALQIVSLTRVTVGTTGRIVVNGRGAVGPQDVRALGAGGGSGGTLVIEAPTLSLSAGAIAVANGGGGAGGCPVCTGFVCDGPDGQHGQLSATRAAGGDCMGAGNGGWEANGVTNPPANGANSDSGAVNASGGGGGGSSGYIFLRARAAANVMVVGGAIVSPPATIGPVIAN